MQKRAIKTKQKILKTSFKLFAEKGFHGTKINDIAYSADVNKQRIYAYFNSKENLFSAAVSHAYQLLAESEENFLNLTEKDIPDLTRKLLENNFRFHIKNPSFWRILAWSNLEESIHVDIIKRIRTNVFLHLKSLYEKGQKKFFFKPKVSFETYFFVLSAVSFFYFSNRKTMCKTLQIDLEDDKVKESVINEINMILENKNGIR